MRRKSRPSEALIGCVAFEWGRDTCLASIAPTRIGTEQTGGELLVANMYIRPGGAVVGEHLHPAIEDFGQPAGRGIGVELDAGAAAGANDRFRGGIPRRKGAMAVRTDRVHGADSAPAKGSGSVALAMNSSDRPKQRAKKFPGAT